MISDHVVDSQTLLIRFFVKELLNGDKVTSDLDHTMLSRLCDLLDKSTQEIVCIVDPNDGHKCAQEMLQLVQIQFL